jgi:transcriptional regulator with XRE-family HTH domain
MVTPSSLLSETLAERKRKNPAYSLRALARDLGMGHPHLSLVMSGKRQLSPTAVGKIARALNLDVAARSALLEGALSARPKRAAAWAEKAHAVSRDRFRAIAEWHHLALLDLTLLADFRPDPAWMAKRLGIRVSEVRAAARRLERLGLLELPSWKKIHPTLSVPNGPPAKAVREFHLQMIEKAKKSLREPPEHRSVTGTTIPANPQRLEEANRRIARFRRKLMHFLSEGPRTELFQLNVQLFSLTRRVR